MDISERIFFGTGQKKKLTQIETTTAQEDDLK